MGAVFSKDDLMVGYHDKIFSLRFSKSRSLSMMSDETLVESGSGSSETTRPFLLLTEWYLARGRCVHSLIDLSEKWATRVRVSPSLGITNGGAKLISGLPLSSLYSSKVPRVLVLCSNPFSNLASIICSVPCFTCISSHRKIFQYLSKSSIAPTKKGAVS